MTDVHLFSFVDSVCTVNFIIALVQISEPKSHFSGIANNLNICRYIFEIQMNFYLKIDLLKVFSPFELYYAYLLINIIKCSLQCFSWYLLFSAYLTSNENLNDNFLLVVVT